MCIRIGWSIGEARHSHGGFAGNNMEEFQAATFRTAFTDVAFAVVDDKVSARHHADGLVGFI